MKRSNNSSAAFAAVLLVAGAAVVLILLGLHPLLVAIPAGILILGAIGSMS